MLKFLRNILQAVCEGHENNEVKGEITQHNEIAR